MIKEESTLLIVIIIAISVIVTMMTVNSQSGWIGYWGNIAGGILSGIITLIGIKITFNNEREQQRIKKEEEKMTLNAIIESFLADEIRYNFDLFYNLNNFMYNLKRYKVPFQHGYSDKKLILDEWNHVKYDLLKYQSEELIRIIEIYKVFRVMGSKTDIDQFSQLEYLKLRKVFTELENKYTHIDEINFN